MMYGNVILYALATHRRCMLMMSNILLVLVREDMCRSSKPGPTDPIPGKYKLLSSIHMFDNCRAYIRVKVHNTSGSGICRTCLQAICGRGQAFRKGIR